MRMFCNVTMIAIALTLVSAFHAAFAQGEFEVPPRIPVSDIFKDLELKTGLYELDAQATNDGVMNHFYLYTNESNHIIVGNELLLTRIHETSMIPVLDDIKKTDAYKEGLKAAGKNTINSFKSLITEPVHTLSNVPSGVHRFFGNMYRATKGERRGEYQDSAAKEIIGFSQVKRGIAQQMAVDPYSSNEDLQEAMTDVAWAMYAGGMTLNVAQITLPPRIVKVPIRVGTTTVRASQMVYSESPESLQKINIGKLEAVGASQQQIDRLLTNKWYSPMRQTVLTECLNQMSGVEGIAQYLDWATDASSEEEAYFTQRSAELLLACHEGQTPLKALHMAAGLPVGETIQGGAVMAFAVDHLAWTENAAGTAKAVRGDLPARMAGSPVDFHVGFTVSEKAKAALKASNFVLHENAIENLLTDVEEETAGEA